MLTMIAIILLPILLDGSPEERKRLATDIPTSPQFEVETLSMDEIRARMVAAKQHSSDLLPSEFPDTPDDAEPISASAEDNKPAYRLDANILPVSWTLQLGSFRSEANAVKLRQSLRDDKQMSYILKTLDDKGSLYRVYVGPMLNKQTLSEMAIKIEAKFKLKSQILRYRISEDINLLGG